MCTSLWIVLIIPLIGCPLLVVWIIAIARMFQWVDTKWK